MSSNTQQYLLERKLAAIMFTDIVGYTALMGKDEAKSLELLRKNRAIHKSLIAKYNGKWLKEMGDGVLAEFSSAYNSICCAIEIQNQTRNELECQLRIGIHLGDVTVENDDIFGDGVNIASRIQSIADPGGIYLSESMQRAVRSRADIDLRDLGEFHLKNVSDPVHIYCVKGQFFPVPSNGRIKEYTVSNFKKLPLVIKISILLTVFFAIYWFGIPEPFSKGDELKSIDLIAVLPFSNTKPDIETDYLGFAIANQIIGDLVYLKNIAVRPSSSVRKYEKQVIDPLIIADELEVDYVLTGNYLKEANIIRLDVELVEAKTNNLILHENIEVDFHNAFHLQDIVAKKVVERLNVQFTPTELSRIGKDIPNNPLAYEYYLRSISYPRTNEGDRLAIEMLNQSIELDSSYAPSYDQLGFRIQGLAQFGLLDPEETKRAESYFKKALSINGVLLSALSNLAMLYTETARTEEAVEISRQVLEINPNNAKAHFSLGYIYRYAGMLNESVLEMERAVSIDSRNSSFRSLGVTYMNLGEYEKAFKAFDIDRGSAYALGYQGLTLARQGKERQAVEYFDRVIAMETQKLWSLVATAIKAFIEGNINEGLIAMRELEQSNITDAEAWYYWGAHYALLGDRDGCVRCLLRAVDGGFFNYPFLLSDPFLDSIRDDPEFKLVLQKVKEKHIAFKNRFF